MRRTFDHGRTSGTIVDAVDIGRVEASLSTKGVQRRQDIDHRKIDIATKIVGEYPTPNSDRAGSCIGVRGENSRGGRRGAGEV
jgi:hypothetical protein